MSVTPIDPGVVVGHVHLKVADLERSIAFYSGVLGFEVMQRMGDGAAFRYPSRASLGRALKRLMEAGIPLEGAADHGVSEALYLRDPDQNGVELYVDRPRELWPRAPDGSLQMVTRPLNIGSLLRAAEEE